MEEPELDIEFAFSLEDKNFGLSGCFKFYRRRDTDPQKVVAKCSVDDLVWVAQELNLSTLCAQFALDLAKAVAHLSTNSCVQPAIDAIQKYLDNPTDENKEAANAAGLAVEAAAFVARVTGRNYFRHYGAVHYTIYLVYEAAGDNLEIIHKLKEIETAFRNNVHNSLMVEVEKYK